MNRYSYQQISRIRILEAKNLLNNGYYSGAYYLSGYAVECGLKACFAKQMRRFDIPDKRIINDVFTHNLVSLVKLAGLSSVFEENRRSDPSFDINWAIVKDWSSEARYSLGITQAQANDLFHACTERGHGVLNWIKMRW
jgi:hypothetical protein